MVISVRVLVVAMAAVGALYAAPAVADKGRFVFTPLAPPGNNGTIFLTEVYQDQAVGWYESSNDREGFVWSAGIYTNLPGVDIFYALSDNGVAVGRNPASKSSYVSYDLATGATRTVSFGPPGGEEFKIGGVNAGGAIAASQYTADKRRTACQPFEQNADGSYVWLAGAKVNGLVSLGLTDNNDVVVQRECGVDPDSSYLYRNGKLKSFRIPGGTRIEIDFVNGSGFGGNFFNVNSQIVGFTATGKGLKVDLYPMPAGSVDVHVLAVGPRHQVAGYLEDSSGYYHGFVYSDNAYHTIDYPKQKSTMITGFSSTGAIVGYFGDAPDSFPSLPFIATCTSDKGCTK